MLYVPPFALDSHNGTDVVSVKSTVFVPSKYFKVLSVVLNQTWPAAGVVGSVASSCIPGF